jgi:hypothetical protein
MEFKKPLCGGRIAGHHLRRDGLRPTGRENRVESIRFVHRHAVPEGALCDAQRASGLGVSGDENPRDPNVLGMSDRTPKLARFPSIGQFVVSHRGNRLRRIGFSSCDRSAVVARELDHGTQLRSARDDIADHDDRRRREVARDPRNRPERCDATLGVRE